MCKYLLKLYVDGSFYDKINNHSIGCMHLVLQKIGKIDRPEKYTKLINLGILPDSNFTEFKALEISLLKVNNYLKKNKISKKKAKIEVYTDSKVIYEVYNKLIPPLRISKLINVFRKIKENLAKFGKSELYFINGKRNVAGEILNGIKKQIDTEIDIERVVANFNLTENNDLNKKCFYIN